MAIIKITKKTLNIRIELMTIFVRQKTWLNWYKPYFPNIDKKYIHIQVTWIETNLCHILAQGFVMC